MERTVDGTVRTRKLCVGIPRRKSERALFLFLCFFFFRLIGQNQCGRITRNTAGKNLPGLKSISLIDQFHVVLFSEARTACLANLPLFSQNRNRQRRKQLDCLSAGWRMVLRRGRVLAAQQDPPWIVQVLPKGMGWWRHHVSKLRNQPRFL